MESGRRAKLPRQRQGVSLDHLVGAGEDRGRHGKAERFGGLEIDDQLEPGRLLDQKIGRLGAVEDLSSVMPKRRHVPMRLGRPLLLVRGCRFSAAPDLAMLVVASRQLRQALA